VLNPGVYIFTLSEGSVNIDPVHVMASIRGPEGLSLVLEESVAKAAGLKPALRGPWIKLNVNSDLEAVGLTAAFATALGQARISCNVVAGLHHDHIFVPVHQAAQAMVELKALQPSDNPGQKVAALNDLSRVWATAGLHHAASSRFRTMVGFKPMPIRLRQKSGSNMKPSARGLATTADSVQWNSNGRQ
jgi:hypothetical protein